MLCCLFFPGTRLVWRSWSSWSVWMTLTLRTSFTVFVCIVISTTRTISVWSLNLSGISSQQWWTSAYALCCSCSESVPSVVMSVRRNQQDCCHYSFYCVDTVGCVSTSYLRTWAFLHAVWSFCVAGPFPVGNTVGQVTGRASGLWKKLLFIAKVFLQNVWRRKADVEPAECWPRFTCRMAIMTDMVGARLITGFWLIKCNTCTYNTCIVNC